LLLLYIYGAPHNPVFFQFIFALSNGPLAVAIIVWKNSLVFHDIEKLTSVFIHFYPPIVTYCLRWWESDQFVVTANPSGTVSLNVTFWWPLLLYMYWQAIYIVKTEILDRHKFESDRELMTSLRWFSVKKPHPIYRLAVSRGWRIKPIVLLIGMRILVRLFAHRSFQRFNCCTRRLRSCL